MCECEILSELYKHLLQNFNPKRITRTANKLESAQLRNSRQTLTRLNEHPPTTAPSTDSNRTALASRDGHET